LRERTVVSIVRDLRRRFLYAQAVAGITGRLGRIVNVTRQDTAALSREVPLGLAAIQEAWPAFESGSTHYTGVG
jgi:hypothetical protein